MAGSHGYSLGGGGGGGAVIGDGSTRLSLNRQKSMVSPDRVAFQTVSATQAWKKLDLKPN